MNENNGQAWATYRLQFNQEFRFTDAQALIPYFSRLGATHLYASPILRARQASTHGYDVVDPSTINPNLGDKTDLINLVTELRKLGLGVVLDIVPNHMAASIENPYWRDVLTYGPSSPFAGWFDIDWRMPEREMWGRVLVPVLGESLRRVLEHDQICVIWSDGRFLVRYFDHNYPVDPATIAMICKFGMAELEGQLGGQNVALEKLKDILTRLERLPKLAARLRRKAKVDRNETEQWLAEFAQIIVQSPRIEQWAEETAGRFGGGEEGRQRLRKLLDAQSYRLVHWRDAARTINYRRFFDINELISIRQEDPQVFADTHAAVLRWVEDGLVDGLRIDHIDGLRDPLGYLEKLVESMRAGERLTAPAVFVEKILAPDEKLPAGWPVEGTTGYEFLNEAEAIFISPDGFAEIEEYYRRMLRRPVRFQQIAARGKRRILSNDLAPHLGRLADILLRILESNRQIQSTAAVEQKETAFVSEFAAAPAGSLASSAATFETPTGSAILPAGRRDLTKPELVNALEEVIVALPVYRTYVDSTHGTVSSADRGYIETALAGAHRSSRAAPEAIDFLGEVLLLDNPFDLPRHEMDERVNFVQRFQQLTGPAAAKGVEDTALYAYVPLASLNEVGGEPHLASGDPRAVLHRTNEERAATQPKAMLCVTTHDTKRTADVRARLDVLSEIPKLWTGYVRRWQRLNRPHCKRVSGKLAPDPSAEYLFYQTLVGIWPVPDPCDCDQQFPDASVLNDLRERLEQYMLKAAREAKTRTNWVKPNASYEKALVTFIRSVLLAADAESSLFLREVHQLVARIARPGFWNSLSRTLIQFTAPGTPDLYQGDELWNYALVDPDNRRPVDYGLRQRLLEDVALRSEDPSTENRAGFLRSLVESPEDGRIKLHLIRCLLHARRANHELFARGRYEPLEASGPAADNVFAFARTTDTQAAIAIAPRLTTSLGSETARPPTGPEVWKDTCVRLPEQYQGRRWTSLLTFGTIADAGQADQANLSVGMTLKSMPVELLIASDETS
jgi:(1->4)-alpha-D-glucan 1-alpha-D-glucosylmutase